MKPLLILLLMVSAATFLTAANTRHASPPALHIHPKVFEMIDSWLSDSVSPVATEINLDAVSANQNQFNSEQVKDEDGWRQWNNPETHGFTRYRVLESRSNRYRIEYQQNGGGSLTTKAILEVAVENRKILVNGKETEMRVLEFIPTRLRDNDPGRFSSLQLRLP